MPTTGASSAAPEVGALPRIFGFNGQRAGDGEELASQARHEMDVPIRIVRWREMWSGACSDAKYDRDVPGKAAEGRRTSGRWREFLQLPTTRSVLHCASSLLRQTSRLKERVINSLIQR